MSYFLLFAIRYIALSFVILFLKTCLELLIKCNNMDLGELMLVDVSFKYAIRSKQSMTR